MLSSTGTGNTIILQKVHFFIFKKKVIMLICQNSLTLFIYL
jgi:hypothetical protein